MSSNNLQDSIRALAKQGVEPAAIAENFNLTEAEVLLVLAARKVTRSDAVIDRIAEMGDEATQVIRELMHNEDVHPVVRLKAATWTAEVATGIKAPQKKLAPDVPLGSVGDAFKQFMDTYTNSLRAAQEDANGVINKHLIEI